MTDTEKVARALWEAGWQEPWDSVETHTKELTKDQARAAIAAYRESLAEQGLVIVPREPTDEMAYEGSLSDEFLTPDIECAAIYRAMIGAYTEGE